VRGLLVAATACGRLCCRLVLFSMWRFCQSRTQLLVCNGMHVWMGSAAVVCQPPTITLFYEVLQVLSCRMLSGRYPGAFGPWNPWSAYVGILINSPRAGMCLDCHLAGGGCNIMLAGRARLLLCGALLVWQPCLACWLLCSSIDTCID